MSRTVALGVFALCLVTIGGCRAATSQTAAPRAAADPHAGAPGAAPLMTSHGQAPAAPVVVEPIAPAPDGLSIADVWKQRKALAGKTVIVRGKVVKANNQILGKNWIHLQDGSGSASDRTNDLTFTTDATVAVGDIVTFTGVLAIGKEIGEGYAYDAIVEDAKVVK